MIQTHRLAGLALFLWGFYLFYTSLTAESGLTVWMEPPATPTPQISPLGMPFYLPLIVGLVSMAFGIYLMIRKKPLLSDQNETESHQEPKLDKEKTLV